MRITRWLLLALCCTACVLPGPSYAANSSYSFKGAYNPVRNLLGYTLNVAALPEKARFAYATVTVRGADGTAIANGRVARLFKNQATDNLPVPVLAPGRYTAEARLFAADDTLLDTQSFAFVKLDEAKEFPWYKNDIGITEESFYPFPAMTVKEDVVTCWNREVTFDGMALPRSLIAGGNNLLTGGIALYGSFDGQTRQCTPTQALKVTKASTGRVEMSGGGVLAGLTVQTKTAMELDGFTLISLTLTPKDNMQLDKLYIDIPLAAQETHLLNAMGTYPDDLCERVPQQDGPVWSSLEMKKNPRMRGNFIPELWLGNYQRGLCWFADDDRGWVPNERKPALELIRAGNTITLRMNLISETYLIDRPRTVTFGLIASPMKPKTRGSRLTEVDFGDTFGAVGMDGSNWSTVVPNKPYEASKQQVDTKMQRWPYLDALAKVNPCLCSGGVLTNDKQTLELFQRRVWRWFDDAHCAGLLCLLPARMGAQGRHCGDLS